MCWQDRPRIHQNPVKAGICKRVEAYTYCSYLEYIGGSSIVDTDYIMQLTTIKKIAKCDNASDFQSLDIKTRDKYLKRLRDKSLSIRQLSRLTGVSYSVVRKFWQHIEPSPVLVPCALRPLCSACALPAVLLSCLLTRWSICCKLQLTEEIS